jgi:ClpP class serine protease
VWSGSRALEAGLVDEIGGFDRTLDLVRESLGISAGADLRLDLYPRPPSLFDYILGRAETFLPIRIPEPFVALLEDQFRLLELPEPLTRIPNSF